MGARNENKDIAGSLCSILENLEGTPADELRSILRILNPSAEADEQHFIDQVRVMQRRLAENTNAELVDSSKLAVESEESIRGLVSEARKRGMTTQEFADVTQLSTSLVMKLDLRQISYSSIPRQIVEKLATAIERSADQVALYLQGAPIRTAILYSDTGESEGEGQRDFIDEVHKDSLLSEGHRARLLKMTT